MPKDKPMRILFILPPNFPCGEFLNANRRYSVRHVRDGNGNDVAVNALISVQPPLGILYISSYLKRYAKKTLDVGLIDFNVILDRITVVDFTDFKTLFINELKKFIAMQGAPDLVCISTIFTTQFLNMVDLADACRELCPNAFITAGGGVPTNLYRDVFNRCVSIDALCYGEGEIPCLGLVESGSMADFCEKSENWITRSTVGKTLRHSMVEHLDDIPFPDYSLLRLDDYQKRPEVRSLLQHDLGRLNMTVMMSRGCPHICCYCASHSVHGRKIRKNGLEYIKEELKRIKDDFHATAIDVWDDNFLHDREWALSVLSLIADSGLTAFFPNALAMYAIDGEILRAMRECHVNMVDLPIESGSERVLTRVMHKPLNRKIIERVTRECSHLGFRMTANVMVGLPGETVADIHDGLRFLKTLPIDWFNVNIASPLPGSEMYDTCLKNSYIAPQQLYLAGYKKPAITTGDFTASQIASASYNINLELNFLNNYGVRIGDFNMAEQEFTRVIKVSDSHALAYFMLAVCRYRRGDGAGAGGCIEKAINILAQDGEWRETFSRHAEEIARLADSHFPPEVAARFKRFMLALQMMQEKG